MQKTQMVKQSDRPKETKETEQTRAVEEIREQFPAAAPELMKTVKRLIGETWDTAQKKTHTAQEAKKY